MVKLGKDLLLLLIVIFSLAFTAWADDSGLVEEEVVVTATRTEQTQLESPGMTEVITEEEIQASGATTLSELLTEEGFVVSSYSGASGAATFRLDGCDATQTLILVDGVPVNTGTMGTADLSYFPTAGISRIEVAHGPLSSLYGSNALGGVVNIITDLTGGPSSDISIAYGNTERNEAGSGEAMVTMVQRKYGLACGSGRADGFRENSKTNNYFFMYQYDFIQKKDEALSLYLKSMAKENRLPGPEYSPTPKDDQRDKKHSLSLIGKKFVINGLWEYKIYSDYWDEESYTYGVDYDYRFSNYGIDVAGQYVWDRHEALFGIDSVYSETDSTDYGGHYLTDTGIFLQDSWSVNGQWKLISGLRWDTASEYNSPVCPRISLVYLANDDFSIKFGYGKSFKAPTISDLYSPYGGNRDLQPETGGRYDITGQWRNNIHSINLNIYRSHLKDGISWVPVDATGWNYMAKNYAKVNTSGLNIKWRAKWNGQINSSLKYSLAHKENWDSATSSYKEDNFFGKNKLALGLGLQFASFLSNLSWEYVWNRSDQTYNDPSSFQLVTVKMDDYHVLNWNLAYSYNDTITYNFNIFNLTDEEYAIYHGYPVSERAYMLSVDYSF